MDGRSAGLLFSRNRGILLTALNIWAGLLYPKLRLGAGSWRSKTSQVPGEKKIRFQVLLGELMRVGALEIQYFAGPRGEKD